jgi:hypothetical protein
MTKKEFYKKCIEMEKKGLTPTLFEPYKKRAIYEKPGIRVVIQ